MRVHVLKSWPEFFEPLRIGTKTFEIRNNDREFDVGDVLLLLEFENDANRYTGRKIGFDVTYITKWQQNPSNVVMSLKRI